MLRVLAAVLVVFGAIAVRDAVDQGGPAGTAGSRVVTYTVDSKVLGRKMPVEVVIPPGARDGRRSLLVFLHGRGEDERSYLNQAMFRALRAQGGKAPVVAFPARRSQLLLARSLERRLGLLRARRGDPADRRSLRDRARADRDRRHLDGRLRRARHRRSRPRPFLRGRRPLARDLGERLGDRRGRVRQRLGLRSPRRDLGGRARPRARSKASASGSTPATRTPSSTRTTRSRARCRRAAPASASTRETAGTRPRTGTRTGSATCSSTRGR